MSALAKKLKLKPTQRIALIQAPEGYLDTLSPLPDDIEIDSDLQGTYDWLQIFVKSKTDLDQMLP